MQVFAVGASAGAATLGECSLHPGKAGELPCAGRRIVREGE